MTVALPLMFTNNASSRLYQATDAGSSSIRVEAGDGDKFPQPLGDGSNYFLVTIEDRRSGQIEICKCYGRSFDILNVERGQEGTAAQDFALGATVSNRLTAATMNLIMSSGGVPGPPGETGSTGPAGPVGPPGTAGIPGAAYVGEFPPVVPLEQGHLWWESDSGNLFVWYQDGDSGQWVQITGPMADGAAPLGSPVFTGDPQAPTPPLGDNDKSIATTAFVTRAVDAISGPEGGIIAPLDSPVFTGDPRAPTPIPSDSDTSIATTAYVTAAVSAATSSIAGLAPINSPVFTGDPRAPTPPAADNDTSVATTAYVTAAVTTATGPGSISDADIAIPATPAAAVDSAKIKFMNVGTGAISRIVQDRMRERDSVLDYGAKGDGIYVTGNTTISSGAATLTVVGASFATTDVGKLIVVPGAGASGKPLATTIATRISSTQVTLAANAVTALSASSRRVLYGTDDLAAFTNAIAALPVTGGIVNVPVGVYVLSGSIAIGNGTSSLASTRYGVRLIGETLPLFPSLDGLYPTNCGTVIAWGGAYAVEGHLIDVKGPLRGFEVSNLLLDGCELTKSGLFLFAASFGTIDNVSFRGFFGAALHTAAPSTSTFVSDGNTSHITAHGLFFTLPALLDACGMYFDGAANGSCSTHSVMIDLVRIYHTPAARSIGVVFKVCDTVTISNMMQVANPANPNCVAVVYDYTAASGYFPGDVLLDQIDVGFGIAVGNQFYVQGTPILALPERYNLIANLGETNGSTYPRNLPNTLVDLPMKVCNDVVLTSIGGPITSVILATPLKNGMWRINYSIEISATGPTGTIMFQIGWTSPHGVRGFSAQAISVTTLGTHTEGSISVYAAPGSIVCQTIFSGISGTPLYTLYVATEKLS